MSRSKQLLAEREDSSPEPQYAAEEQEESDSDVEIEVEEEIQKDDTEQELERLVFGDRAGFKDSLAKFSAEQTVAIPETDENTGLEGLDDADVG